MFFPQAIVYYYLEFKPRFPKNMKLFSIRIKELFQPSRSLSNAIGGAADAARRTDIWITKSLPELSSGETKRGHW